MQKWKEFFLSLIPAIGLGALAGWMGAQLAWVYRQLAGMDVEHSLAAHLNQGEKGKQALASEKSDSYSMRHSVQDGIERIVYTPKQRRFETPILMLHGMWHGAWCWRLWQELFAVWGWESLSFSLPGHAESPVQRPIRRCTLDYYLGFLKDEVKRFDRKPIVMGHSMGGALIQWYLKYIGDDLPATVLVAPWTAHSILAAGFLRLVTLDPIGSMLISPAWDASPFVRSPQSAARLLISDQAVYSPQELHASLGPESALVLLQHNPPLWRPPEELNTPMLWLAGEKDAGISEADQRRSALFYKSDYYLAPNAGHNLMMEDNFRESALFVSDWLAERVLE